MRQSARKWALLEKSRKSETRPRGYLEENKNKTGIGNPELFFLAICKKLEIEKRVVLRVIGSIAEECER